jgi:hypothetical protein
MKLARSRSIGTFQVSSGLAEIRSWCLDFSRPALPGPALVAHNLLCARLSHPPSDETAVFLASGKGRPLAPLSAGEGWRQLWL